MPESVSERINGNSHTIETIQALCDVVDVDNDNKPAPESIPPQSTDPTSSLLNTEWVIVDSVRGRVSPCHTMA